MNHGRQSGAHRVVDEHHIESPTYHRDIVLQALPKLADYAELKSPTGAYLFWGHALNWPDWLREGTSLGGTGPLPRFIAATDDAIILANLLDRIGPAALLSSIVKDTRIPLETRLLTQFSCAPDATSMLQILAQMIDLQNPHVSAHVQIAGNHCCIHFASLPELQAVGACIEHAIALCALRITEHYHTALAETVSNPPESPALHLRSASQDVIHQLSLLGRFEVKSGRDMTCMKVPAAWCREPNPYYDPVIWANAVETLRALEAENEKTYSVAGLRVALRRIIESEHRMPRLKEIAQLQGVSERTIARRLAALDVSFQELADEIRQEEAMRMLVDTSRSIEGIARTLGYSNSASFGRAFRHWYNISPSRARRAMSSSQPSR